MELLETSLGAKYTLSTAYVPWSNATVESVYKKKLRLMRAFSAEFTYRKLSVILSLLKASSATLHICTFAVVLKSRFVQVWRPETHQHGAPIHKLS